MINYIYRIIPVACLMLLGSASVLAQGTQLSPVAQILDQQVKMIEGEFVSLAEAMPADKYDFAPTEGEFKGVRTFGQQVKHTGAVIYLVSYGLLGKTPPAEIGTDENGPADLKTKDECVNYLKKAFAFAHTAIAGITDANATEKVKMAWGDQPRLFLAQTIVWHSFDHYGQSVVYLRMNGIIPPASRPKQ